MNIPLNRLLQKMEEEIKQAQATSTEASIRERVRAIKTLCELVLDEPRGASSPLVSSPRQAQPQQTARQQLTRALDDDDYGEDDSNGDSLFDF